MAAAILSAPAGCRDSLPERGQALLAPFLRFVALDRPDSDAIARTDTRGRTAIDHAGGDFSAGRRSAPALRRHAGKSC
jgi:hypothetical protein